MICCQKVAPANGLEKYRAVMSGNFALCIRELWQPVAVQPRDRFDRFSRRNAHGDDE